MAPKTYDNTAKIVGFLDKHLALRVLKHLENVPGYNRADVLFTQYTMLRDTKLFDELDAVVQSLSEESVELSDKPGTSQINQQVKQTDFSGEQPDIEAEKATLKEQLASPSEGVARVLEALESDDIRDLLRPHDARYNSQLVMEKCEIDADAINGLYELGKLNYEAGLYTEASRILSDYVMIANSAEQSTEALWGRFAADIMSGLDEYNAAYDSLSRLRDVIDKSFSASHTVTLQQRTWLLHWSLFVFINHERGSDGLIDLFLNTNYVSCIQASAPWLLRYVVAMLITNDRRRNQLREVAKLVSQENYHLDDPVCEFLKALYVDVDFDKAARALQECPAIFKSDYFLADKVDTFLTSARQLFFDICSIVYSSISIKELASLLTFESEADAYEWAEASSHEVDRDHGVLIVEPDTDNVYSSVSDKMRSIISRSQALEGAAGKREDEKKQRGGKQQQQH
ncbi:eukaryotic translation initiation factor 3 subunit E [Sorochytrium milnesiophthora]